MLVEEVPRCPHAKRPELRLYGGSNSQIHRLLFHSASDHTEQLEGIPVRGVRTYRATNGCRTMALGLICSCGNFTLRHAVMPSCRHIAYCFGSGWGLGLGLPCGTSGGPSSSLESRHSGSYCTPRVVSYTTHRASNVNRASDDLQATQRIMDSMVEKTKRLNSTPLDAVFSPSPDVLDSHSPTTRKHLEKVEEPPTINYRLVGQLPPKASL